VTLVLADHADIGRGDVLARSGAAPEITDQFAAHLMWLDEHPPLPSRTYQLRIGTRMVPGVNGGQDPRKDGGTRCCCRSEAFSS